MWSYNMDTTLIVLTQLVLLHTVSGSLVNVALNKPASMSSYFGSPGLHAGGAVDGITSSGWPNAIATTLNQPFAWWKVDLQREVQDTAVRIYFRTDFKVRRNGVQLYTSTSPFPTSNPTSQGHLCHTVTGDPSGNDIPDVYSVTCPGRWRYLLLYTDTDNDGQGAVLDFGEVEVYACDSGYYGPGCRLLCSDLNCGPPSTECHQVTGQCLHGCQPGYTELNCTEECESGTYGDGCSLSCSDRRCSVQSSECGHVTGQCEGGCQAGYKEGDCRQACDFGINYGVNCTKSCSDRLCYQPSSECDTRTGQCIDGCQVGWTGLDCTSLCSEDTYGPGCKEKCGKCDGVCDSVDGRCPAGCLYGYCGIKCDLALGVCMDGSYGLGCTEKCGKCDGVCDSVDGRCPAGCLDGYCGIKCDVALTGGVVSLVGAVVGTFLVVVLLGVGIHIYLIRQGRLQWIKTSEAKQSVQESRDFAQMSSIVPRPADFSQHAQPRNQVHINDYAVLNTGQIQGNNDYDVIKPKNYLSL